MLVCLPSPLINTQIMLILQCSDFLEYLHLSERTVLLPRVAGRCREKLSALDCVISVPHWIRHYLVEICYPSQLEIFLSA